MAAVQLVGYNDHDTAYIREEALEFLEDQIDLADRELVVIAGVGNSRNGTSFFLNQVATYLADYNGLCEGDEFSFRSGSAQYTEGIYMSRPYVLGAKYAVLLLDVEGFHDRLIPQRNLFAASALVSSLLVFNMHECISGRIIERLKFLNEVGLALTEGDSRAFEQLEILVKNWPYVNEIPYGNRGGDRLLQNWLSESQADDQTSMRTLLSDLFSEVNCFLLPNPGEYASHADDHVQRQELLPDFADNLDMWMATRLRPGKISPKILSGRTLKLKDFGEVFKLFFNAVNVPGLDIWFGLEKYLEENHIAVRKLALEKYQSAIKIAQDNITGGIKEEALNDLHGQEMNQALLSYREAFKLGGERSATAHIALLEKEIMKCYRHIKCAEENKRDYTSTVGAVNSSPLERDKAKLEWEMRCAERECQVHSLDIIRNESLSERVRNLRIRELNVNLDTKLLDLKRKMSMLNN